MEDAMANTILKELREFRTENNKRWEANDKKWEANDKKWEENDKRWEQNEKRWQENDRRWKENERRWNENNARWEQNNSKWESNTKILTSMEKRITALEEGRKKDRNDIVEILDRMQNSINSQFNEMKEYFDAKFEKVFAAQRVFEIENQQFKKILYINEKRLNFYNSRLNYLEKWKEEFDMGEFEAV